VFQISRGRKGAILFLWCSSWASSGFETGSTGSRIWCSGLFLSQRMCKGTDRKKRSVRKLFLGGRDFSTAELIGSDGCIWDGPQFSLSRCQRHFLLLAFGHKSLTHFGDPDDVGGRSLQHHHHPISHSSKNRLGRSTTVSVLDLCHPTV